MFLLDTNTVTQLVRDPHGRLAQRVARMPATEVATSVICTGEMWYGSERRGPGRLRFQLEQVLGSLEVLPLSDDIDRHYGRLRVSLERAGRVIGNNDLWIAVHALSLGATLVTDNVREFERVEGLAVENWLRA